MAILVRDVCVFVLTGGVFGLLAHIFGEALPRRLFSCEAPPFAPFKGEERLYRRLGVHRLKKYLPDASRMGLFPGMLRKELQGNLSPEHLQCLARETCVAETVHWGLFAASPLFSVVLKGPWRRLVAALYALSNIPFVLTQRYNRPRLLRACRRALARDSRANPPKEA